MALASAPGPASQPVFDALVRLSRFDRGDTGLERQEKDIRDWAAREGVVIDRLYVEEESGFDPNSPRAGLRKIHERLHDGVIQGAVFWKGDRLGRRGMAQVGQLVDAGRIVFLVDGMDSSKPGHRGPMAWAAETARQESENISLRVRNVKAHLRPKGRWLGGPIPAFYWNDSGFLRLDRDAVDEDGKLILRGLVDEALAGATINQLARKLTDAGIPAPRAGKWDARVVRKAIDNPDPAVWGEEALERIRAASSGGLIPPQIARDLNDAGIPAPGSAWQANTVSQLLKNPVLVGWLPIGKKSENGKSRWGKRGDYARDPETGEPVVVAEAVMTPGERSRLLEIIRSRKIVDSKGHGRGKRASASPLTGKVFCECGARMANNGDAYVCTSARRGAATAYVTIWKKSLDRMAKAKVIEVLATLPEDHPLIAKAAAIWTEAADPEVAAEHRRRKGALADAKAALRDIRDARYLKGEFDEGDADDVAEWERLFAIAKERVEAAKRALAALELPEPKLDLVRDAGELEAMWEEASPERQRLLLDLVVGRIVVRRARNGRGKPFEPERVEIYGYDGGRI